LRERLSGDGLDLTLVDSDAALQAGVLAGDYPVGIALPPAMLAEVQAGAKPQAQLYLTAELPPELKEAYTVLLEEIAFLVSGQVLTIETTETILGPDLAGRQIAPRDRMLPLLAVIVLLMETLALTSLISSEIEGRTLQALLVTPMRVQDLFISKGLVGVGLAFGQAMLILIITGGLSRAPLLLAAALLLGALLATGLGFMLASVARDMMSVMAWGVVTLIVLIIPALMVLLPGLATTWIRLIPSYYLVDTVHRALNFGAGWGAVWQNLLVLLATAVAFFWLGMAALRRKFQ
jgi:ABC-2 type transport system permease protein